MVRWKEAHEYNDDMARCPKCKSSRVFLIIEDSTPEKINCRTCGCTFQPDGLLAIDEDTVVYTNEFGEQVELKTTLGEKVNLGMKDFEALFRRKSKKK